MGSEEFMGLVDIAVCVLKNIRGMMEPPPELNEAVSHVTPITTHHMGGVIRIKYL